jgi:hypothetical protein
MVLDLAIHVLLFDARFLRDLERVVAAFDDMEIGPGGEPVDDRTQLVWCAEGVARALNKQHRRLDPGEMLGAQTIGPARRMQRVAEKNQACQNAGTGSGDLRGNAAAHRLAADRQPVLSEFRKLENGLYDPTITVLQPAVRIRQPASSLGIEKIEGDDVDVARRQRIGKFDHEMAGLGGAGAVAEDQGDAGPVLRSGRVNQGRHALVGGEVYAKLCRHGSIGGAFMRGRQYISTWPRRGR